MNNDFFSLDLLGTGTTAPQAQQNNFSFDNLLSNPVSSSKNGQNNNVNLLI